MIGEATELRLVRGGRGRAEIHLETDRPAGALLDAAPGPQRGARHAAGDPGDADLPLPSDPFLGPGVLALTDIISDPYPAYSVIPSRCRVTYDRRLLAGETAEAVLGDITGLPGLEGIELRAAIAQGEHETYTGALLRGPKFLPAWLLEETDPFVQTALQGLHAAGLDPQFGAYRFCTNAAYSAGTAGVPTVGFGPGPRSRTRT